jgi:hypothetical protein
VVGGWVSNFKRKYIDMQKKTIMATATILCLVALYVTSCKKHVPPPNTEAPKSSETSKLDDSKQGRCDSETILAMQGRKLSEEDIKELETKLQTNPEDIVSRIKLLGWYSQKRFSLESARKGRHKHILWFIQNNPDAQIAGAPETHLDPTMDKEVYYEAKNLWLGQTEAQKTNTAVLGNASKFFLIHDRKISEELLKKAQVLEPGNPEWPAQLGHLYNLGLTCKSTDAKAEAASQALKQFERSLAITSSDQEKFYQLADLAKMAYNAGDLKKAEIYANDLLTQAVQYKNDWNYGNAIHHGNIVLGRIALRSDDLEKAKQYLLKAGKTPGSPQLNSFGPNMALAKELLEKNEKEIVIQYFDLCGIFWKMGQNKLNKWTTLAKEGNIPDFRANLSY